MDLYKATDFVKRELKQPPWLVEKLIPAYISMIFAWGKVGKSIMSVQLAHALTMGNDFLGYPIDRKLKVLYYQCDLPEGEWQYQLKELDKSEDWWTIWEMPGLLMDAGRTEQLTQLVEKEQFDLVVFDSLLSCSEGSDLDDAKEIRLIIGKLRKITKDKPIWLIHHKRKGQPGVPDKSNVAAAGSFALGAGVSTLIDLVEGGIEIKGRYVRANLELKRDPDNGLWLPKTTIKKGDPKLFKIGN